VAAITTDIPPSWRNPRPTRLLAPVPEMPGAVGHCSLQAVGGRALRPSRLTGPVRVAPAAYRLRRAVALVVVVGLMFTAWVGLQALAGGPGASGASASASSATAPQTIEVGPGDTFWSIASRLQPDGDLRPLVDRLVAAHGGGVLQAGERLTVPRG